MSKSVKREYSGLKMRIYFIYNIIKGSLMVLKGLHSQYT